MTTFNILAPNVGKVEYGQQLRNHLFDVLNRTNKVEEFLRDVLDAANEADDGTLTNQNGEAKKIWADTRKAGTGDITNLSVVEKRAYVGASLGRIMAGSNPDYAAYQAFIQAVRHAAPKYPDVLGDEEDELTVLVSDLNRNGISPATKRVLAEEILRRLGVGDMFLLV